MSDYEYFIPVHLLQTYIQNVFAVLSCKFTLKANS